MCDILVATPRATKNKKMIFAKNSDRDPNEAQIIEYIPRKKHEKNEIKLTYVSFPQVSRTNAVVLSRPWWIWGAEMGANEYGLTIGNTAVFTTQKVEKNGILGMDMIRLALERCKNAKDALKFIIDIIENYSQGGSGSYDHDFLYHNSFIIADPKESYVLETAGNHWVYIHIEKYYSISNALTINDYWDEASDSVIKLSKKLTNFSFSKYFSDKIYTHFSHGRERQKRTYNFLAQNEGNIDFNSMLQILRSHHKHDFSPLNPSMKSICMHYGGKTKPSQTASSQISILGEKSIHWFTGESLPCLSVFKPFSFEFPFWNNGSTPKNRYDSTNFWWKAELLHRKFTLAYTQHIHKFKKERDALQNRIFEIYKDHPESATKWTLQEESEFINRWLKRIQIQRIPIKYKMIWEKINRIAHIPIMEGS